jgi:hypothetical protein
MALGVAMGLTEVVLVVFVLDEAGLVVPVLLVFVLDNAEPAGTVLDPQAARTSAATANGTTPKALGKWRTVDMGRTIGSESREIWHVTSPDRHRRERCAATGPTLPCRR